jgi:hypothetical protein
MKQNMTAKGNKARAKERIKTKRGTNYKTWGTKYIRTMEQNMTAKGSKLARRNKWNLNEKQNCKIRGTNI